MSNIIGGIELDAVVSRKGYQIWKKLSSDGCSFWGVGDFCGLHDSEARKEQDLVSLEWEGNEIYVDYSSDVISLVIYALGVAKSWKEQMESEYNSVPFDIILSVDDGSEVGSPSVTLRFWAVRNGEHYVTPSIDELERFKQPVLMECVNYVM